MSKLVSWFYGTYLGALYFEFLLWLDSKKEKKTKFLTPKEISQVIREYSLVDEGVVRMKSTINDLINSKTKDEYHKFLIQIEDMMVFAENDKNDTKAKFIDFLKSKMDFSNTDVKSDTDMAKIIDRRINDTKEMWNHQAKRQLLRDIRKAGEAGDKELVNKLQMEFKSKYGGSSSRPRQS